MEDLRNAFEEYGYVSDIFIPKPFRNFAFVTFHSSDVAQLLIGRTLTVKECAVIIGSAVPKITGNKKALSAQYPIYSYNEQSFPARYGWSGYDQAPYKSRQDRNSATYNNYPGLIPNSSYMVPNGRAHLSSAGMISIDYGHQTSDMGQNTAAMAALNILNNPDVVAAIVAAAGKTGQSSNNIYPHMQGSMQ